MCHCCICERVCLFVFQPSLTRKAAIKVKKTSVNPNSSYQSIIRIRAKEARRSMKASPDVDEGVCGWVGVCALFFVCVCVCTCIHA